ncbi:MAG: NAD(P)/FAD-dependent oxidoreductase [Promethearchaeota archaeon]
MKFDVAVLGAGFAGSCICDFLADKFSVVLIDAHKEITRQIPHGVIFAKHNYSAFSKENSLLLDNKEIFPKKHYEVTYSGKEYEGVVDGREFNDNVGMMCNLHKLNEFLNKRAEKKGAELYFSTKIDEVKINTNGIELIYNFNSGQKSIKADLLIIATGSGLYKKEFFSNKYSYQDIKAKTFQIQRSIGFKAPDLYFGVFTRFTGDNTTIQQNIPHDYIYHLNRKISPSGPLFSTRWVEHFDIGILHNDINKAIDRLIAVIKRYKKIENYFKNVKPYRFERGELAPNAENIYIIKKLVSKHWIPQRAKNRTIVIGEAAGLVTGFFFEGTTGCAHSARIAADVISEYFEKFDENINKTDTNFANLLQRYDAILEKRLINTYMKSQAGGEVLWLEPGDLGEKIFNIYAKLLHDRSDLRKMVYEALILDDLEKYNFANDRKTGEEIYKALPLSLKIISTPIFLKAAFN